MAGDSLRRRVRRPHLHLVPGLLVLVGLVAAPAANAQFVPSAPADAGVPEPRAPEPFTISEIAVEANRATSALTALQGVLEPSSRVETIREELPALSRELRRRAQAPTQRRSLRELDERRQGWLASRSYLDASQASLASRSSSFEGHIRHLTEMDERWAATQTMDPPPPAPAMAQIEAIRNDIAATQRRLRQQIEDVLAIQGRVSGAQAIVTESIARIDQQQARQRHQLLDRTASPLIPGVGSDGDANGDDSEATPPPSEDDEQEILTAIGASVARFARRELGGLSLHALWILLMIAAAYHVRRHSPSPPLVVRRPLASSIYVGLVVFPFVHLFAPGILQDLAFACALPLALRLLQTASQRRAVLLALPALAIDLARLATPEHSMRHRVLLLALAGATALPIGWLWRERRRVGATDAHPDWMLRGRSMLLMGAALTTALIGSAAVVLGYVPLGNLLLDAATEGLFVAGTLALAIDVTMSYAASATLSPLVRKLKIVDHHPDVVLLWTRRIALGGAFLGWTYTVLQGLRVWTPLTRAVAAELGTPHRFGNLSITLGGIGSFVASIILAIGSSRAVGFVLDEDVLPRLRLGRGVGPTVSMLARYTIIGCGFALAVAASGVELSELAFLLGALGVGIGFGLQTVVSNFVAGLILIFERPVKIGDVIEAGTLVGEVTSIGIRASVVKSANGAEIIVPNAELISNRVINWTLSSRNRRVDVAVGVAYGTRIDDVVDLLTATARDLDIVIPYPAPMTIFDGFGDSSLNFTVRVWIREHQDWPVAQTRLGAAIDTALAEAGIEIPFPQRVVHLPENESTAEAGSGPEPSARDASEQA